MDIENKKELVYHVEHAIEIMYNSLPDCYKNKVSLEEIQRETTSDDVLTEWQHDICMYCEEVISSKRIERE